MTNKEIVMMYAKMYNVGSDNPDEYNSADLNVCKVSLEKNSEYQHVDFYCVGHNSSHNFYLGIDDQDNAYYMAYSYYSSLTEACNCKKKYSYGENHPCYDLSNIKEYITENVKKLDGSLLDKQMYLGHW